MMVFMPLVLVLIGQFCRDQIGLRGHTWPLKRNWPTNNRRIENSQTTTNQSPQFLHFKDTEFGGMTRADKLLSRRWSAILSAPAICFKCWWNCAVIFGDDFMRGGVGKKLMCLPKILYHHTSFSIWSRWSSATISLNFCFRFYTIHRKNKQTNKQTNKQPWTRQGSFLVLQAQCFLC